MNPLLTKAHEILRQQVREFAEREIKHVAQHLDETSTFSPELTRKMGDFGLFGINLPEKFGGRNLDTLSYIIAVEELARVDSSQAATVASHNSLGIGPIFQFGTEKQKEDLLPGLCTGERLWAFGLTEETAGSDARGTKSEARLEGDQWVINGSKMFITNSASVLSYGSAVQVVTGTRNGEKELSVILVPRDTPGYHCERISNKMMWRAADTGRLFFENCRVPKENLLGTRGMGAKVMLQTLDSGRLSIAAMGLGLAQGAYEMALDYARKREQFGHPIAKYQSIAFKLADMDMKIELARNTLYKACRMKDDNLPFGRDAAIAKLYCSEIAREIADEAVQIHGAYGLFKENDIERFYRDQRILQIGEGTSEILRMVIARYMGLKHLM
ncbi:MAG TPA: acyl-CoA dehydrogenase family protein [Bacteroidales bacterium]|nr:acyl-CoA dehydrogenase family protein [Bacteroidales bacterium]